MASIDHRVAYYTTGKIEKAKTARKLFDNTNLIGIITVYSDGTHDVENVLPDPSAEQEIESNPTAKIAKLRFEANKQFKHDGGDTPEIIALRRENR